MARIVCDFYSETLQTSTNMTVLLPQSVGKGKQKKHPTLYLLHGLMDDHTTWTRLTSIERYVEPLGIAVVMPSVGRSFYTDMEHGYNYFTFVSKELPEVARTFFPLSDLREENFVAGLSMGGYGAMKMVLTYPDKFSVGASLSGSVDIEARIPAFPKDFSSIFGDRKVKNSGDDLFYLAEKLSSSTNQKPLLYLNCGTEDHNYDANIRFRDHLQELQLDPVYEEAPGGHDWSYWDHHIQKILQIINK